VQFIYNEAMTREATNNLETGNSVINTIRYADLFH